MTAPHTPATRGEIESYTDAVMAESVSAGAPDSSTSVDRSLADRQPLRIVEVSPVHDGTHAVISNGLLSWCRDCDWWVRS